MLLPQPLLWLVERATCFPLPGECPGRILPFAPVEQRLGRGGGDNGAPDQRGAQIEAPGQAALVEADEGVGERQEQDKVAQGVMRPIPGAPAGSSKQACSGKTSFFPLA
jgi:hypothetical protein